jgi:uncharacterized membrane protein
MAAAEQAHRHAVENKLVDNEISQGRLALTEGIKQAKRGQFFGVGLAVLFLVATVFVMWYGMKHDHDWVAGVGGAAIIAEVVGLVYIFARERNDVSEEMAQKKQAGFAGRALQPEPEQHGQTEIGQGAESRPPQPPSAPGAATQPPPRTSGAEAN